jgi:hypothetical protein
VKPDHSSRRKVPALILPVILTMILGCSTSVEQFPGEAAREAARESIRRGGSDPATWQIQSDCLNMGPCRVTITSPKLPGTVLAINRYRVKDSKPTLNGADNIEELSSKVNRRGCFGRHRGEKRLARCLGVFSD